MKSILLTSTALVAFAGAAAADGHASISHAFSGKIGYTDNANAQDARDGDARFTGTEDTTGFGEEGFYWEGNLKVTASAELDNGLTAGAYFETTIAEDTAASGGDDDGIDVVASDFLLSLESETASLFFGDTGPAGSKNWVSAGDMEADAFSTDSDSNVLRGDMTFGSVNASIGYIVDDANNEAEQLSFSAGASFGAISLAAAYQEETDFVDAEGDFNGDEVFGVSAAGTFAGATVTVAYAENSTDDAQSTGIKIAYPFGPVTATAYYVMEEGTDLPDEDDNFGVNLAYASGPIDASLDYQDDQGVEKWKLEGSYDAGNGLTVLAGALNENEGDDADYYVGATYDLGGGAEALFVYAADEDGDQKDEIGAGEYDAGVTIQVSFEF